jgi:hypothetical protein
MQRDSDQPLLPGWLGRAKCEWYNFAKRGAPHWHCRTCGLNSMVKHCPFSAPAASLPETPE